MGIVKAYTTRVGAGPLPSEIGGDLEDQIREKGHEYGASTGRPRRCGWFDAVVVRYSVRVNGLDSLALTKLDVLDDQPEMMICTAYAREARRSASFRPTSRCSTAASPSTRRFRMADLDGGHPRFRPCCRRRHSAT